jgi:hypothetical protein
MEFIYRINGDLIMRKENNYNLMKKEATSFNRAIAMQHIIDGPKTVKQLAEIMFINDLSAFEILQYLEAFKFAVAEKVKVVRLVKAYSAINVDKFPWCRSYVASENPRRDYFDKMVYPNLHKELRDAIFEGRISKDVVKTYNRAATARWALNYKSDYHGGFQSTMNGEYFV